MKNLNYEDYKTRNPLLDLAGTMTEQEADDFLNSIYEDKYDKKCAKCNRQLYNHYPNLRSQFPILKTQLNGHGLTYLDSAATSQKPQEVIDATTNFYSNHNASSHSVHSLGGKVTEMVEETRQIVADFIGSEYEEIVFTSGATEGINLIANGFLEVSLRNIKNFLPDVTPVTSCQPLCKGQFLQHDTISYNPFCLDSDSEILICVDQHHSNILPWQRLAELVGCKIVFFGILASGRWDVSDFKSKLNIDTKVIAISNVSNVLAIVQDVNELNLILENTYNTKKTPAGLRRQPLIKEQFSFRPIIILDATQAVSHFPINAKELNIDFMVFSGHKIYGPTGIGVLYGKKVLLKVLPNYKVGGDMVESVSLTSNNYKELPYRFEAGTANFASIICLKAALTWFIRSRDEIFNIESELLEYLVRKLSEIKGLEILGNNFENRIPLVSFNIKGVNSLDLALLLDQKGVCIRSGQHCAGILHEYLGLNYSCRISLACFNTFEEIDTVIECIKNAIKILK